MELEQVHDSNYGDIALEEELQKGVETGRAWTEVRSLTEDLKDQCVLFRGRVNGIRSVGKKMTFLTVRKRVNTVQCVVEAKDGLHNTEMLKYVLGLSKESLVDVEGVVQVPTRAIASATQKVEVKVRKIHCVNRAATGLPITLEDAARSKVEFEKALKARKQLAHVNQDTRLNHRVLDLRTPANQAIFRLQSQLLNFFRQFLLKNEFLEIITPKLVAGTSEGGASVFELNYFDQPASLTQSAQLYKQMAISADFHRVFVVGPSFRAEKSYTHRHLCEFTGLDVEMEIVDRYHEVMDIVDSLFVEMFDKLKDTCQIELDTIGKQYPFKPLKYLPKTLRLTFAEGIQMLQYLPKFY